MAKRFIQPEWKELRKLPEHLQRAWFYIWDKADNCGVYQYDKDYMKLDLSLTDTIHISELADLPHCEILPGERILIKNFLVVNYTQLKPGYNPHKPAFRDLDKNRLKLNSSLNQAYVKLEEEDIDEDKEEDEKGVQGEKQSFRTMPQPGDVGDLPDVKIQKAIEALKIQTDQTVDTNTIVSMWDVFKIQNLTGTKYYADVGAVEAHFLNWILKKKFERNGIGKTKQERTTDSLTRLAQRGAEALERIRAKSS